MATHVVAHLSDLHLDGGPVALARARRVMDHLDGLSTTLDAVLMTGDLTAEGRPEEYAQVAELIASSRHPVFTCPGNHDARGPYRAALFDESPDDGTPVNRVHRTDGVTFAMCDSTVPGESGGHLSDATLAWLEAVLRDTPDRVPVVVACHHPPVPLHSPVLDGIRQAGGERLAAVVEQFPHVAAILCGHAHTAAATTFAGLPLRVAPGVVSTLTLPWEDGPLLDPTQPPGLAFHILDGAAPDGAAPDGTAPDGAAPVPGWQVVTHYRTL